MPRSSGGTRPAPRAPRVARSSRRRERAAAAVALRAQKAVVALNAKCDDFCRKVLLRAHDDVASGLDAWLRDNRQPLLETAAIYAARRRPFTGKSVEASVDLSAPVQRILDVATRRQQLLPTIAPLVEERDARATTGCDAALGAVMAVAAQRNEARLIQAQQRLEALATAAERAAAGASGAVGAIAHPDIQQTIADEKESRRTAAVSEFRAQRRAVDAELADLRTTRARAVRVARAAELGAVHDDADLVVRRCRQRPEAGRAELELGAVLVQRDERRELRRLVQLALLGVEERDLGRASGALLLAHRGAATARCGRAEERSRRSST